MIPIATGLVTIQLVLELVRMLRNLKTPPAEATKVCELIDDTNL